MKPGFFYLAGVQSFEKNLDEAESFRGDSNMVGRDTDLFLDPQDQDDDYEGYTEDEKNGQFAKPTVMLALYRDDDALDEEGVDDTDPCAHFRNTPLIEKYRRGDEPLMDEKLAGAQAEFNIEANQGFELGYSDNAFFTWKAKLDRLLNSPLVLKLGWAFTGLRFCGPEVGVFDSWYGQLDLDYWDGNPDPGVGSSLSVWEKA
ncbi:MAG: hypothetical protein LBL84_00685 [Candidatus Nomurabacteria bacterium]|nr:hypothetical protein [Candidatus Nomurabacteria bacterium]